jgi:hypothetical protein
MHSTILKRVALLMEKWRSVRLSCSSLLLAGFVCATILSVASFAQAPLNFGNNFFVTGDYFVAGAHGINTNFTTINGASYTTGVISVPDPNPGITGANQLPKGAQIVAALLYWQTIEKAGVAPGAKGSGQNGYFRPLLYSTTGGPAAPGYAFSGTNVSPSSKVSWGPGGCSGTSTGDVLQTYRADVAASLPLDANGNPTANGSFQVSLPSAVLSPPFTLGATLVVIYRILSGAGGPNIPLNAIVLYEGDYAQAKPQVTMTQPLLGFYDAAQNPVSRLTHIVGHGGIGFQTVYLNGKPLPSLYGSKLPSFPGYYDLLWDNPTWTFTSASTNPANPVTAGSSSATTLVVPSSSVLGCVTEGAVIVSTTVQNSDNDGILDSWKESNPPGYCDAALENGVCEVGDSADPGWVPLPGATHGEQDVFLQYDYMCSSMSGGLCGAGGSNYSFDPRSVVDTQDGLTPHATPIDKVVAAYEKHNIHLHAIPGNAILESQSSCAATDITNGSLTCPFPNEPGTVGFSAGLVYIKNQTIDTQMGQLGCTSTDPNPCIPVFQHGKKDSYHYALFSHGVGVPNWFLLDGSLSKVQQSGNTVTFTTSLPHGIAQITQQANYATATDTVCTNGRVTVVFATTNSNLNGTFCVLSNPAPTATTFSITVLGSSTNFTYTSKTDPNLAVANGQVTTISGYSDVGGQNSVISLGYGGWGPPSNPTSDGNKWQVKAGTLAHEGGHTMALTHGGTFLNNLANNPNDYTPTYEANCKPNVQTVMSYLFQFDLLAVPGQLNAALQPLMVVDYSEDPPPLNPELIPTLTKSSPEGPGILDNLSYATTAAFELTSYTGGNNSVSPHCNGTPLLATDKPMTYVQFSTPGFFWSSATGEDINFDGNTTDVLHPHNEWEGTPAENGAGLSPGLNLQQVSAAGTITAIGPGGAGGFKPGGGASGLYPVGGAGGFKPGGGGFKPGGGSSGEITHQEANSYARPPQDLSIVQEEASPRFVDLSWFAPTFGTVVTYNIYQSIAGGAFNLHASVPGSQTTFQDTVTCNAGGYSYRVTAVTTNDAGQLQESVPSNTVPATGQEPVTGCYVVTNFSSSTSAVQGSSVPITWTLTDDFYATPANGWASAASGNPVTNLLASTLSAIGPFPSDQGCPAAPPAGTPVTTLLSKGVVQSQSGTFGSSNNHFTFNWNTTPFNAGCYFFTLNLDSGQSETTTSPLTLLIFESDTTPHILSTTLPTATAAIPYTNTIQESGGTGALTWSITAGALPSGMSLGPNSGTVAGTPTTAGNYNFTVKVTDSLGNFGTQAFTLKVLIFLSDSAPPTINTTLPPATAGIAYSNTIQTTGGTGMLTWSITAGALPPGLSLSQLGVVSGTPTTADNYSFTVQVTDSASPANVASQAFTLKVLIFLSDSAPPTINTTLPPATAGIAYSNTIQTTGGTGMLTWSITAGALPPGLSLSQLGVVSGTPTTADNYSFTVQVTDSASPANVASQAFTLTVLIFESDSNAPAVTTNLPAGTVVSPYSNTIDEVGGTGTLTWSITAGALPPGLSLSQLGVVSGTPTAPGNYNFTVQVTDSASPPNVATLAFMLSVADAQYGDLIVVDGSPLASPLAGTLFRITPTGTSGTIAAISNGSPTGVAVDPNTGNIYVAVDSVSGSGTTRIVKIGPSGTLTDPFVPGAPATVLQNPVAVAVDASGNVYVGDNSTNAIYEFNSSGTQLGAGPFASLPNSNSVPNHIRMAFDSLGNLDVASDNIGGTAGQIEVDQVPPGGGTPAVLYNTTTKSTATYALTQAGNESSGYTTYTGTIPPTLCVGSSVTITGFATTANDGTFIVQSCTSTTLVVNNPSGTMDTSGGTAALQLTAIGTVGGIAAFSDGSIDVADYGAQTIYKITNPGMTNMAITADISATSALCCNMSGMANPPGAPTTLFVTLTGANSTTPQLQQAVPATSTVTTVNSTYALTVASVASGGNTTYTGTFSPTIPVGSLVTITGFTNATNNGTFTVVSCSSTQLIVNNGSGIAETNPGIAVTAPLTFPNDVAWYDYPPPG